MAVKPEEIATLIELFSTSNWDELHVEIEGLQLFLSTDPSARLARGDSATAAPVLASPSAAEPRTRAPASSPSASTPAAAAGSPQQFGEIPPHWVAVKAPNLGTFYRSPKPGAAPFVEIDQKVEASTEVCLLEVMKLFTAVQAGVAGSVRRVAVKDADMVEHDQVLFWIEP